MKFTKLTIFLWSLFIGFTCVYGYHLIPQLERTKKVNYQQIYLLENDVYVTSQIETTKIGNNLFLPYKTIIDMQPDVEETESLKSQNIGAVTHKTGKSFFYIPVPQGKIPEKTVSELSTILSQCERPVLLYCQSGKRALKIYALSAASRENGPELDAINKLAATAGQNISDIQSELVIRIENRNKTTK